jgi:hypothetical protein
MANALVAHQGTSFRAWRAPRSYCFEHDVHLGSCLKEGSRRVSAAASNDEQSDVRACPYCKEEIKADAIKCKHCGSRVTPEKPSHGGVCPFCKEEIHPEAVRCKHCRSELNAGTGDCGCGSASHGAMAPGSWGSWAGFAPEGGGQPFRRAVPAFGGMSEWPSPGLGGVSVGSGGTVTYMASKVCGDCSENLRLNKWGNASGTRTCRIRVCARDPYGGLICTDFPPFRENCELDIQYW